MQNRLKKRKRDEELAGVSDFYLGDLEDKHEMWLEQELHVQPINALRLPDTVAAAVDEAIDAWMD